MITIIICYILYGDDEALQETQALLNNRLLTLLDDIIKHDGHGSLKVDVRLLKRGQKEVIVECGKHYRFIVDMPKTVKQGQLAEV